MNRCAGAGAIDSFHVPFLLVVPAGMLVAAWVPGLLRWAPGPGRCPVAVSSPRAGGAHHGGPVGHVGVDRLVVPVFVVFLVVAVAAMVAFRLAARVADSFHTAASFPLLEPIGLHTDGGHCEYQCL